MSTPSNLLTAVRKAGLESVRSGLRAAGSTASATIGDLLRSQPEDPLGERDPRFIRATLPVYRRLTDVYFRPKVRGLENVPAEGPALLVGNHSGGTLIVDSFVFAYAFYEALGADRRFHQLAHDLAVGLPALSALLRKYGTVRASQDNARRALATGAAVLVYPGGDYETYRPSWQSADVDFGGRTGFVRLALEQGVPIVPVVAIGGQETALFVTRGQRLARLLQLDRLLRIKVLPIQLAPPFGITVMDLPARLPLPAQITIEVLPPIDPSRRFGADPDEREVYEAVSEEMQRALGRLSAERDLPVVGTVGPRAPEPDAPRAAMPPQPWPGYDRMRVPEVARRLDAEPADVVAAAEAYERSSKRRKGVLAAVERERRLRLATR